MYSNNDDSLSQYHAENSMNKVTTTVRRDYGIFQSSEQKGVHFVYPIPYVTLSYLQSHENFFYKFSVHYQNTNICYCRPTLFANEWHLQLIGMLLVILLGYYLGYLTMGLECSSSLSGSLPECKINACNHKHRSTRDRGDMSPLSTG